MTFDFAVAPDEIETGRRKRIWQLAAVELPLLRVAGSALLSIAVYVNNLFLETSAPTDWVTPAVVMAVYAAAAWLLAIAFLRRRPDSDPSMLLLLGDLPVWTVAIYFSGGERSWLYFVLLLRVADQIQTTLRRAMTFALAGTACFGAMLAWIVFVDGRPEAMRIGLPKLLFILLAGIYISLAARTSEHRRQRMTETVRMSRDLIRRLEEAHARAEEASAAKSEFVANMSHEMRTPLQGVIGMLQLAIEDEPAESTLRRLETARRSAETLMAMIDDVLDFSRIEARKLELEPVYFPLREMISETMKSVGPLAASKRLTLSYSIHPDCPETVWGDPVRLRQIIVNLVGNAIKFTHEGEIAVLVSRSGARMRFDVRDTGVGIAPAIRQRIFEPFTQGDSSHSRRYGGAGLGLSIVVRLLEAMGGAVEVSSEQGTGSVFSFSIPLPADAVGATQEREAWESSLAGRSVVVVEPAETSRTIMAEILRSRGVFASAFARAADVPRGRYACAVTCDPSLPVHPQVVVSSPLDHLPHPIQITRPVGERELLDAVGAALGLTRRAAWFTLSPEVRTQSRRLLLVDDSEVNREVVAEMLRRMGHEVTTAIDGEEALFVLSSATFDAIFLDVQLPGIDGLEVARRYRSGGGPTPIIALTAHTSPHDRDRCLAAGMNAVLSKPVGPPQLAEALVEVGTTTKARKGEFADIASSPLVMARLRDAFRRQTPDLMTRIRDAASRGDAEALSREAHKLKGSLSYFGGDAAAVAREVDAAAKKGDTARAAALLPDLETAVAELSVRLARAE